MSIDIFNSRLLTLIQKNYRGSAYFKVIEAFETLEKSGSLEQACSKMFRESFAPITPPSKEALENFGKGNISQDYLTIQYIDDLLAKSFEIIKENQNKETYQYDNSLAGYELLKAQQFLIQGGFQEVEKRHLIPRELLYRLELYNHFYKIFRTEVEGNVVEEQPAPYTLSNIDDLAFCGICGLLDVYLNNSGENFDFIPINLNFIPTQPTQDKKQLSKIPISQNVLKTILKNNRSEDIFSGPATKLRSFGYANETANLKDDKPSVNTSLSNLLASSSFLWDEQIFGISPDKIEAMTPDERILFLAKNKSAVIDSCLSHLLGFTEIEVLNTEIKPKLISLSEQIKRILQERDALKKQQQLFEKQKSDSQALLEEAGAMKGANSAEVLSKLFEYLEKGFEVPEVDSSLSKLDVLMLKLLKDYRQGAIQSSYFSKQIEEKNLEIEDKKETLEELFFSFANQLSSNSLKDQSFANRFLESYVVFSFIVFNKEIFPDAPFKTYQKKQAAKKFLRFFEKKSQDNKPSMIRAFDKLKDNAMGDIQELLDRRLDTVFSAFKQPSNQGKIKTLSPKDLDAMIQVSQSIETGDKNTAESFHKLTEFLEQVLVKDQSFWGSIDRLSSRLSPQKLLTLQAHMNACLMLLKDNNPLEGMGIPQGLGFNKLMKDLLYSLGERGIQIKGLEKDKSFIQSIQDFSIPVETTKPFDRAIQKAVAFSNDKLEKTTLELKPPRESVQLKKMAQMIAKLTAYIADKMEYEFSGSSKFLSSRSDKKSITWSALEDTFNKLPLRELDLTEEDRRLMKRTIGLVQTDDTLFKGLVKDFIVENNISTRILDYQGWQDWIKNGSGYDVIDLAVVCQLLTNRYRAKKRLLENNQPIEISQQYEGASENKADIFIPELLNLYEEKQKESTNNQDIAIGLHRQFLPIFLSSFFSDINQTHLGKEFFIKQKMELIKHIPEADKTFADIQEFMKVRKNELKEMADYIEAVFNKDELFTESGFRKVYLYVKNQVGELTTGWFQDLPEAALAGMLIAIAAGMTPIGAIPYLSLFMGFLGAYFWTKHISPVMKDLFHLIKEGCKYYGTSKYTTQGVNDFILGMVKTALDAEIKLLSNPKWNDLRHELGFALFLQEEFSMIKNLRSDLAVFPDRLNHLVSQSVQNSNLSSMGMNLFYMFNKELFSLLPDELMRGVSSPVFMEALSEYVQAYQDLIQSKLLGYQGSESDKSLAYGRPSPFKSELIEQAKKGELVLTFPRRSKVFQFIDQMRSDISQGGVSFVLKPNQILPVDQIDISLQVSNLKAFLKQNEELLGTEKQYQQGLAISLGKIKSSSKPLDANLENIALQGVVSSYYMLRLCLSEAERLKNPLMGEENRWLNATGSTVKGVLTSALFRDSFSLLNKTTEFARVTAVPGSQKATEALLKIENAVQEFLQGGELNLPSFEEMQSLVNAFQEMASYLGTNPQIGLPILLEYENNQNILLPQIIYQQAVKTLDQSLGENSQIVIQGNFRSKVLYLTNNDSEIFFTGVGSRGVGLSPFVIDALQEVIRGNQDDRLMRYLGMAGDRKTQFINAQQMIPRFNKAMQRFYPQGNRALPPIGSNEIQTNPIEKLPEGMSYRPEVNSRPQILGESPNNQNSGMYQANPYQNNSGNPNPIMNPNNLPRGRENEVPLPNQSNPPLNQGVSDGLSQNIPNPGQNTNPRTSSNQAPMFFPMMMGGENNPLENNPLEVENKPQELESLNQESPNLVQVNAQGGSGSFSGGGNDFSQGLDENGRQLYDERNQIMQEGNANIPERVPPNFLGNGNPEDYQNPLMPQAENLVGQRPEGFPLGKAAAIGGGLALGASILSSLLSEDKDKKKKGNRR